MEPRIGATRSRVSPCWWDVWRVVQDASPPLCLSFTQLHLSLHPHAMQPKKKSETEREEREKREERDKQETDREERQRRDEMEREIGRRERREKSDDDDDDDDSALSADPRRINSNSGQQDS